MKKYFRLAAMMLAVVITLITLTGCRMDDKSTSTTPNPTVSSATPTVIPTVVEERNGVLPMSGSSIVDSSAVAEGLDLKQRNSINMLNHLAVLTQEINASQNSRLYLDEAYSLLISNTYPNAVDNRTLSHLAAILDTLNEYRMADVKRERLEYVYEQNRAQALRSAVPSPLGLMSTVQSFSLAKLAASVMYMAVDSAASYSSASAQSDMQYLQNGWALDDEALTALHNSRKDTFTYMVRIVGDYDLPGDLALSEAAIDEFVQWKNNDNAVQRIRFFESNVETYQALGTYWLALAESYYENGQFEDCIKAIASYEALATRIFRYDYEFARVLPLAVISAGATMSVSDYVQAAEHYIKLILENTDQADWSSRYFVAQIYVDLYTRTNNDAYLSCAYEIVLDNVNHLVNEQKKLNEKYLKPVENIATPQDATKVQKAEIKNYNEMLKAQRKVELPPVCEPLLLNCELLFALADELSIDAKQKSEIQSILHKDEASIFLTSPLDNSFWFDYQTEDLNASVISFNGEKLTVPANLLCADSLIRVTVVPANGEEPAIFEDWVIEKVERKIEGDLSTFTAFFKSISADWFDYKADAVITIEIMTSNEDTRPPITFEYVTTAEKTLFVIDSVGFRRVEK